LGAYVDGELPPEDRRAVEFHLGDCADCWTFLATYRETVALGKELRDEDLPAEVYARLEDMTRSAEGGVVAPPAPQAERRPRS
jgi:anti-sigma factor RsiW